MKLINQEGKEEDHPQVLSEVSEIGIDEVGRGAIFGPVFSAAVVLMRAIQHLPIGVKDSKLTLKQENYFFLKL